MDPRIREGDQGANKKENQGIFTAKTQRKIRMDPRIREGNQGSRQVIRASLLLLGGLRVFAVKILGFGAVCKEGKKSAGEGLCSKKKHLPRIYTELDGKQRKEPLSVIFANAEIHIYSKARMDPRIREGDQGANKKENQGIFTAKTQRAQRKTSMDPRIREGDQGANKRGNQSRKR